MAPEKTPKRKATAAPARKTVKTSVLLDAETHARLAVAASIAGQDKNAFLNSVLAEALRGIVIIDRRKSAGRVDSSGEGIGGEAA